MEENKSGRKLMNAVLILILLVDLFMITMWVLSTAGISPIPNYPAALQLTGYLLVLAAVIVSFVENRNKK